jgi:PQQ-dependent dehydrogenase (methanol/ethanol family)
MGKSGDIGSRQLYVSIRAMQANMRQLALTVLAVSVAAVSVAAVAVARAADNWGAAAPSSDWRFIGNNLEQQHFSSLKQINGSTVKNLGLAWYADMPTKDGMTGVPLVTDGVVYQSGAMGTVFANDVRTGAPIWTFDAHLQFPLPVVASYGARLTRGLALWEDQVIFATGDCRLIALNRKSGRKNWESSACDPKNYKTITGAPRVGNGMVFIGNSNEDSGIGRGHVDAFDVITGKHLWRFYTIPGDPSRGFESKAMESASKTWGNGYANFAGGGTVWDGITYDPQLNLLFVGTDGPSPLVPTSRGEGRGDELFTTCIVALDANTGAYVWHYQTTPGDGWNYDATMPIMIADIAVGGKIRHVVMQAPKNGFFYVLDAKTGKLINQPRNIVPINWASHIDTKTGRPVQREAAKYWLANHNPAVVMPGPTGAHGWMPMSFNPSTRLVYIPTMQMATLIGLDKSSGAVDIDYYYALTHRMPFKGSLLAYDPIAQKARWRHDIGPPYEGGTLSTAGDLVFQGTSTGYLIAYRADNGEKLWSRFTGSGILGAPSTVQIDGEQLIIVAAGSGTTSAVGFFKNVAGNPGGPPRLLAFKLNGNVALPLVQPPSDVIPEPPRPRPAHALALQGKAVYEANYCELCHGFRVIGGIGSVPDLRKASAKTHDMFMAIVLGGLLTDNGMPVFNESITSEQALSLQAYILEQAWRAFDAQGDNKAQR